MIIFLRAVSIISANALIFFSTMCLLNYANEGALGEAGAGQLIVAVIFILPIGIIGGIITIGAYAIELKKNGKVWRGVILAFVVHVFGILAGLFLISVNSSML